MSTSFLNWSHACRLFFLFFLQSCDNIGNLVNFSIKLEKLVANFRLEKQILPSNFVPKKTTNCGQEKKITEQLAHVQKLVQ